MHYMLADKMAYLRLGVFTENLFLLLHILSGHMIFVKVNENRIHSLRNLKKQKRLNVVK